MVFSKILVPTDGSEYTKAAIMKAVELAKVTGSSITALYVLDQTIFVNMPLVRQQLGSLFHSGDRGSGPCHL